MVDDAYDRFHVPRPEHIGDAHTAAIELELERFRLAFDAGDAGDAIGHLKCLVEAIAKSVLDLNGTPAVGDASFESTANRAHKLLAGQRGHELAHETPFGNLATQARKMTDSLGEIRNGYGSGHGRARLPVLRDEMLDLAVDGALLWSRWAIRRIGYFAQGRPEVLIRDLVGDPGGRINFFAGDVTSRLLGADLAHAEPHHARSIGVAVGQRAAQDTFNVRMEGVDQAIADGDLERWPSSYRIGVANGLVFSATEAPTITFQHLLSALQVLTPATDSPEEVVAFLRQLVASQPPGPLSDDPASDATLLRVAELNRSTRSGEERKAWGDLIAHLAGESTRSSA